MKKLFLLTLAFVASLTAMAQTNLTSGKTVEPLGGLNDGISFDNLQLITVDNNTTNVFLLPEPSATGTPIQGFYIDLGASKSIGAVRSTWEGADCGANIYVTDTEPAADGALTGETLIATFDNAQASTKDAAVTVSNSGRYIVFVPTVPTNVGWGVKIRTFVALEKEASVLTSLDVTPTMVKVGEPTEMTFTAKDQLGVTLTEGVTFAATNATLSGTTLTAAAAGEVKITATYNGVSVSKTIMAVSVSAPTANPTEPTDLPANVIAVYSAKYGKGLVDNNPVWGVGGGAPNPLYSSLQEVEIADGHKVVHVVGTGFNNRTAGGVGITTDYTKICVALYPFVATEAKIFGDNAYANALTVTGLVPGQWNYVELANESNFPNYMLVELVGESEFYLDHFYFAKPALDDTQAPTLDVAELVSAGIGSATLKLKATDDKSTQVTYVITDQNSKTYTTKGNSGVEITYTIGGLEYGADYTFTITAKDDNENVSDSKTVTATTLALVAAPVPDKAAADVISIYSNAYTGATGYGYGGWGQSTVVTDQKVGDDDLLMLNNFNYLGFEYTADIDLKDMEYLHIDVLPLQDMTLGITPIMRGGTPTENSTSVGTLVPGQWNGMDVKLSDLGLDYENYQSFQLKIDKGSGADILYIDNIYFWKASTAPATEKTIYLNPNIWDVADATEAYAAYVFNEEGNEWIDMTPVEDTNYFTATIPTFYTGLILTRRNAGSEMNWDNNNIWNQTSDIDFTQVADNTLFTITSWDGDGGKSAYNTSTYVAPTTYTATFKNSIGWDEVYAYAYTEGEPVKEYLGAWPGTKLTDVEGKLTISFKATEAPAFIIFNNGNGGDGNQTANLEFENGKEYDMAGATPEQPTNGEGSYTIPSGQNEGKELKYTWAFTQTGMDVTVTFANVSEDDIVGIVDGYVFDKTDGFQEIAGLTYTWTNCTEGQVITAAHKWMFAEGDFVTPDFTYTVKESQGGEPPVEQTYTATFKNSVGWDEVYAYAYTEGEPVKEYLGAWPGTKLTDVEGTLTISFDATEAPAFIIFNNGNGGDGNQTANLEFENGKEYDMAGETPIEDPVTIPEEPTADEADVLAVFSAKYGKEELTMANPVWGGYKDATGEDLYTSFEYIELTATDESKHKVVHVLGTGINSRTKDDISAAGYNKFCAAIWPTTATSAVIFQDNDYVGRVTITGLIPGQWNYIEQAVAFNNAYITIALDGETEFYADHIYYKKEITDGITAPRSTLSTQPYYDLSGRRVETPSKGVYILNGKKILMK